MSDECVEAMAVLLTAAVCLGALVPGSVTLAHLGRLVGRGFGFG